MGRGIGAWVALGLAIAALGAGLAGAQGVHYRACASDERCGGGDSCFEITNPDNGHTANMCTRPCETDDDCPVGPTGNVGCDTRSGLMVCYPRCGPTAGEGREDVPCADGFTCDNGICMPE
jgi:hypothetical protein